MPLTNQEARDRFLPLYENYLKPRIGWVLAFSKRRYEGDAQTSHQLRLQRTTTAFTANVVSAENDAGRDVAMPAHESGDVEEQTLTIDQAARHSAYESALDILESADGVLPVVMRDQARVIAEAVNTNVQGAFVAGLANPNDAENTAGLRRGNENAYVDDDGNPQGASKDEAFPFFNDILVTVGARYRALNAWKTGEMEYQPLAIVSNAVWTSFQRYIDEEKPSDQLVNQFAGTDGLMVGGIAGVWKDIPVVVSNDLDKFAAGGKQHHPVIITNHAALTLAMRSPTMEIEQGFVLHQASDGTLTRRNGWTSDVETRYGRRVVDNRLMFRYGIRAEA